MIKKQKSKEEKEFEKTFGKVCRCGIRHNFNLNTPGYNLPKSTTEKCRYEQETK